MQSKLHECVRCKEVTDTNLELEDDLFICEDWAMIVGELADMVEE